MAGAQALRDQIVSVYLQLARTSDLEEERARVFHAATLSAEQRESEAAQHFADRTDILVAAKVPALTQKNLTPEQRLSAEVQLYRREETERFRLIALHEDEIKSAKMRLAEAEREYAAVTRSLHELRQQIRNNQEVEKLEIDHLLVERDQAIAQIAAESDAEARRVLSTLDDSVASARAHATAECEAELQGAENSVLQSLNTYAATCRVRVKGVAVEMGGVASAQAEHVVKPAMDRLEAAKTANLTAAAQLSVQRDKLSRLYAAVQVGRDPGDDISGLASSFPLLPLDSTGGRGRLAAPSSPGGSPTVSPTHRRAGAGLASPTGGSSSSSQAGGGRAGSTATVGGGIGGSGAGINPALVDVLATLESRDAASLGLTSGRARKEVAAMIDKTIGAWTTGPAAHPEAALAFLRATQAAIAPGAQPVTSLEAHSVALASAQSRALDGSPSHGRVLHGTSGGASGAVGLDVAGMYRAEAEAVPARAGVYNARAALQGALAEQHATKLGSSAGAKSDAAKAVTAAQGAVTAAQAELERVTARAAAT